MGDIVERLRAPLDRYGDDCREEDHALMQQAADEIERLEDERRDLPQLLRQWVSHKLLQLRG
jgi:hypothetical protein